MRDELLDWVNERIEDLGDPKDNTMLEHGMLFAYCELRKYLLMRGE